MKTLLLVSGICLFSSSCSTIDQSFELGASIGSAGGALASYVGHSSAGGKASLENVAMGSGIGIGVGLIAAYFVHKSVEQDREYVRDGETEMHFGDLPPSPFVVPKNKKRGD
jgi:hypothetical protein